MAASRAVAAAASAGVAAAAAAYYFQDDAPPLHSALQPGRQLVCPLVAKTPLTPDTSRYRFALPTPAHSLGLPVASHVLAVDAGNMYREYTPVTLDGVDRLVGASGAIECVGLRAAVYGRKRDRRPLFARCSLSRDVPRRRVVRARSGGRAGGGAKLST